MINKLNFTSFDDDSAPVNESVDGAPPDSLQGQRSRRRRKPVSCDYCRSRKLKCDKNQPCLSCIKKNDSNCVYAVVAGGSEDNSLIGQQKLGITKNKVSHTSNHSSSSSLSSSRLKSGLQPSKSFSGSLDSSPTETYDMEFLRPTHLERRQPAETPGSSTSAASIHSNRSNDDFIPLGLTPGEFVDDTGTNTGTKGITLDDILSGEKQKNSDVPLKKRLDRMESILLSMVMERQNVTAAAAAASSSVSDHNSISDETGDESSTYEHKTSVSSHSDSGKASSGDTASAADPVEQLRESLGMLKLDRRGKSIYHGDTHWITLFQDLSEVQEFFKSMKEMTGDFMKKEPLCNHMEPAPASFAGPFHSSRYSGKEILDSIPDDAQCDALLKRYFECIKPVYNVINEMWFYEKLQTFRKSPNDAEVLWIALLLCMLILAVQSYPDNARPPIIQEYVDNKLVIWAEGVESCCDLGRLTSKPSVLNVRVLLLWQFAQSPKGDNSECAWYNSGLVTRVAQSMGLYRDPHYFTLSSFEVEERRRMWAYVMILDSSNAVLQGLPCGIHAEEYDVEPPGNYVSEDPLWAFGRVPAPKRPSVYTSSSYLIASLELLKLRNIAYTSNLNITKPVLTYKELWKLDAEIRSFYKNLPKHFRRKCDESSPNDPLELVIQRFLLEVDFCKTIIVLHRAYSQRVTNSEMFVSSRNVSREASLRILELHHWLICRPENRELVERFNWAISCFSMPYVIHAVIALSVAIINKDTVDAAVGRKLLEHARLTNEVMEQCGRDNLVVVNSMILQLNRAVLQHALKVESLSNSENRSALKGQLGDIDTFTPAMPVTRNSITQRLSLASKSDRALVIGLDASDVDFMVDAMYDGGQNRGYDSEAMAEVGPSAANDAGITTDGIVNAVNPVAPNVQNTSPDSWNTSGTRSTSSEISPHDININGSAPGVGPFVNTPDVSNDLKSQMIYDLTKQIQSGEMDPGVNMNDLLASDEWDSFMRNLDEEIGSETVFPV